MYGVAALKNFTDDLVIICLSWIDPKDPQFCRYPTKSKVPHTILKKKSPPSIGWTKEPMQLLRTNIETYNDAFKELRDIIRDSETSSDDEPKKRRIYIPKRYESTDDENVPAQPSKKSKNQFKKPGPNLQNTKNQAFKIPSSLVKLPIPPESQSVLANISEKMESRSNLQPNNLDDFLREEGMDIDEYIKSITNNDEDEVESIASKSDDTAFSDHESDPSKSPVFFDSQQQNQQQSAESVAQVQAGSSNLSPPPHFVAPYGREFVGDKAPPPGAKFFLPTETISKLYKMNAQQLMVLMIDDMARFSARVDAQNGELMHIKETLKSLRTSISKEIRPDFDAIQIDELPLSTISAVNAFEEKLQSDSEYRKKAFQKLSLVGGKSVADMVRNILIIMFMDECAMKCSYSGKGGNEKLKGLLLTSMIRGAVRTHFASASDEEIKENMSNWLKNAKKRFQDKQRAQAKRREEENVANDSMFV